MGKIYIDVYFLINFTVDLLSLLSVGKILLFPASRLRFALGAGLGAAYSVFDFFFPLPIILHILTAAAMVCIVSHKIRLLTVTTGVVLFIFCEIFIGGCITALKELSSLFSERSLILAAFIILISIIGSNVYSLAEFVMKKRLESISLTARLWHRGRRSDLVLMVDSGNLVREYMSKRRVIFVRAEAISESIGDPETLFEREKCYVIPIDTTSGKSSVIGFIPDRLEFSDKKYNNEEFIVVPDIHGGKFGGYDGIAPLL